MSSKKHVAALALGSALLALIAASPSYGQGKGNESGAGKPSSVKIDRNGASGDNGAKAERGGQAGAASGNDKAGRAGSARGNADRDGPASGREVKTRSDRGEGKSAKGNQPFSDDMRGAPARNRGEFDRNDGAGGFASRELRDAFGARPRLIDGCPPGLAKKRNGCLPPGQAKDRYRSFEPGFFGLNGAEGGRFFYEDGYLLQYRPGGLAGFLPLLGGALGIGNIWPASYAAAPLPNYYSDYFQLGDRDGYRYADNVIYRVDPQTTAITSVAGLLTGNEFEIGRPMPRGYDVYNVPFDLREQYADTAQDRYRYADGYVYRIDPGTALVTSALALVF
jgi:hypothetical protein